VKRARRFSAQGGAAFFATFTRPADGVAFAPEHEAFIFSNLKLSANNLVWWRERKSQIVGATVQ